MQRDRQPLADAGSLVDLLIGACLERDFLDRFTHELGNDDVAALQPGFLGRDGHGGAARRRVVRADLRPDAVLERRDDLAARGVVLGVGAEHHQHVERQADGVALYLDVALLQDVEQPDLDLAGEIRQLVDGEDAAVRSRHQAIVHRQLVGEIEAGTRGLDRIDVADHVGDGDVRCGELLDVALVARQPADGKGVAFRLDARAAGGAQRRQRVVVNLAARHHGNLVVEQAREGAQDAALRLAAQAEQDEIVARQHGVDDLRDDRVVVADDAGEERLSGAEAGDQVLAHLVAHRATLDAAGGDGGAKFS